MSDPLPERSAGAHRSDDAAERDVLGPGLVHELLQPLTGLEAGLRLVERELGSSVTQLDGWRIATTQLARVHETLRTYHRLMSADRTDDGPFLVEPIVRRCVDELRDRIDGAGARVSVLIEPDVPQAHGSARALLHALVNLVRNALDAVEETGEPGRIEVRALRAMDSVARAQVRVADEGAGIPPHRRARLFAPGFTTKPEGRGSGLGLTVSRRMLRRAGGELRLGAPTDPSRRPWSSTELVIDLAAAADAPAPRERPSPARAGLRQAALAAALVAGLGAALFVGWAGFRSWVRSGDAPATPVTSDAPPSVEVVSAEGRVERRRGGEWAPVTPGERLLADDGIRADAGAGATLAVGASTRIMVSDATELTVREITAAVERLQLTRGRISVDHQADGARVVVVESDGGERVARAGTARFSVLATGAALAVATEAGVVRLQSAGEAVEVAAGQQSVAVAGAVPAPAAPIPVSLLLKVARAANDGRGSCVVEGVVPPGAEVRVDGRSVEPGPNGRFTVRVSRSPGRDRANVLTRDAAGRIVERRVRCADEPAVSDFAVRWGNDAPVGPRR